MGKYDTGRHREWTYTIYGNVDMLSKKMKKKQKQICCEYHICAKEICPETKNRHLQGYLKFKNGKSRSALQKWTGGGKHHAEIAKGTPIQNRNYCWKGNKKKKGTPAPQEDADFWAIGTLPVGQGKRTDIMKQKEALENGANMRNVIVTATSNQSIQFAGKWLSMFERKRKWKPYVEWICGPTGSNKTRYAYKTFGDNCYECTEDGKWWDGYDGHENVIIDEFRSGFMPFDKLLRLLDRYPFRVAVKYGFRQFLAKRIIITSNRHPRDIFDYLMNEDIQQLMRRIDEVKIFKKKKFICCNKIIAHYGMEEGDLYVNHHKKLMKAVFNEIKKKGRKKLAQK